MHKETKSQEQCPSDYPINVITKYETAEEFNALFEKHNKLFLMISQEMTDLEQHRQKEMNILQTIHRLYINKFCSEDNDEDNNEDNSYWYH